MSPAPPTASADAPLVARRSVTHALIQVVLALGLGGLMLASLPSLAETRDAWLPVTFFIVIVGFYAWQALAQLRERKPQAIVAPDGLTVPEALAEAIPWRRIRDVQIRGLIGGARIDIEVDPATFARMRMGQRFMGDHIIRCRGRLYGFSLLTQGLDRRGDQIQAAIRRYWPPDIDHRGDEDRDG